MAYVSTNYKTNPKAPVGKWTCAPSSALAPFDKPPTAQKEAPNLCGQCVSYVKKVCPTLPATSIWRKGQQIKGSTGIAEGTVIASFNAAGLYAGHAAIYVRHDMGGIQVYDQWISGVAPKAVGPRVLRWNAVGMSNDGDQFYVVD